MKKIIWLILMMVTLTAVCGFETETASYDVFNYHQGIDGNEGESSSYTFRFTGTYQTSGNNQVDTTLRTLDAGHFKEYQAIAEEVVVEEEPRIRGGFNVTIEQPQEQPDRSYAWIILLILAVIIIVVIYLSIRYKNND